MREHEAQRATDGDFSVLSTAAPDKADELPDILAQARRSGWRVVLLGHGTKHAYGAPSPGSWAVVTTERLRRIVRHRPEDLTVTVEAGVRLGELEAVLAAAGQTLGWDVPGQEAATVGGAVAAGIDGPRQAVHGRLRDDVLAVQAVLADGRAVRSGAPVVKNVAGYDLNRLWVGSWGSLGCITQVTLKVRPLPRAAATHVTRLADGEHAQAWRTKVAGLVQATGAVLLAADEVRGVVHLEGRTRGVAEALRRLGSGDVYEGEEGISLLSQALAPGGPVPTVFLSADPSAVVERLFALRELCPGARLAGDVLNGWVRVAGPVPVLDGVVAEGGPYRWEGARAVLGDRRLFGPPRREEALWWELLEAFDPERRWCRERLWPERLSALMGREK